MITIGLTAHVDAGKTTLSKSLLYTAGVLRKTGRVDHGDAFLDTYELEKERGITIFSKQAVLPWCVLMDTPGHVDFSPEMERTLRVLDYAILVISGTDGIQGHTLTLWRLFSEYKVPVFIFINKMDQPDTDKESILSDLTGTFGDGVVDFSDVDTDAWYDSLAMTDEALMESYLNNGSISDELISNGIISRKIFPCFFGSALKQEGITEFYNALNRFTKKDIPEAAKAADFGAVVYKISRDDKGTRLTHIRVINGILKPKMILDNNEKTDQLRLYSGDKYELISEAGPGDICAVTGLKETYPGQGLGTCEDMDIPILKPVLRYRMLLPDDTPEVVFLPKLMELNEELPELQITHEKYLSSEGNQESAIYARVMGQVQIEILQTVIQDRYDVEVSFGDAEIVYKETVTKAVEGIGHYEPLRHYAEAHVLIEPGEAGSGITIESKVSEDDLALNWQRLIMTHLGEKEHRGVLIGAGLADVKMTVIGGKAHLKHTEGGDFRQATYRAVRMGLMQAECKLLEPYYDFTLKVAQDHVGRAITDIERMSGTFSLENVRDLSVLTGQAPVATMQNYAKEVAAYTAGTGELSLSFHGYLPCHNETEVIEASSYDPELDEENPTGSVFCSHGAGYYVPWNEVADMAHIQTK